MRTLIFVFAGFVLFAVFVGLAKPISSIVADSMRLATLAFFAVWLVIAAINMRAGVASAGYTVAEEFPIFLLIFGLPAALAVFIEWKLL